MCILFSWSNDSTIFFICRYLFHKLLFMSLTILYHVFFLSYAVGEQPWFPNDAGEAVLSYV